MGIGRNTLRPKWFQLMNKFVDRLSSKKKKLNNEGPNFFMICSNDTNV